MKYTKATDYALHIVAYMVKFDNNDNLSLQPLAKRFQISPTYLSKILTQLVKADIIQSTTGKNGGYILRKKKEEITFYDVITAIEGSGSLFTCGMNEEGECRIQNVMTEAGQVLESYLKEKRIYDIINDL